MWILTSTDGDLDEPAEEEDTHRVGQRDESQELFKLMNRICDKLFAS